MDPKDKSGQLSLSRPFTFWFSYAGDKGKVQKDNYENEIKALGSFNTAEQFWGYYQHMVRPENLPVGCKFSVFQEGIKPAWEDKANEGGGGFILRVKKNYANKFWEDLLLSFIGEQCDENDDICGLNLKVNANDVNIQIWISNVDDEVRGYIHEWIKITLGFYDKIDIEFRNHPKHNDGSQKQNPKKFERNDDKKK